MGRTGLSWRVEPRPEGAWVALSGELTEASDFTPLLGTLPGSVTFDVAEIERINSCGVREWVKFIGALGSAGTALTLERCSVPFVAQLNMIANFRGNATVRSVFAPFYCPSCEHRHDQLVEVGPEAIEVVRGTLPCPSCGAQMEFDDLPESFFDFQAHVG